MRAMPHVQKMHDRYRDRGVLILGISYETTDVLQPFLNKNSYTMAVGSDPEKKVIGAYGVRGWPSTYLIDKTGKIAYVGGPYSVESAIEKALGLESSPATLLTAYVDTLAAKKKADIRNAIERLTEKATADFDLRAWAAGSGGVAATVNKPTKIDAAKLLASCVKASVRKMADERKKHLDVLASWGPETFDLVGWARTAFGKSFPIKSKELKRLLADKKHDGAMNALVARNPKAAVVTVAAKNSAFKSWCASKLDQTRTFAKKAIMAKHWVFANRQAKDNKGFWNELSVSGIATSKDRKRVTGILLGGGTLLATKVDAFIHEHLAKAFLMEALSLGRKPKLARVKKSVESEAKRILTALEGKYGRLRDSK